MKLVATVNGRRQIVEVSGGHGHYRVVVDERTIEVDARRTGDGLYSLVIDGASRVADVSPSARGVHVDLDGATYLVEVEEHARHTIRTRGAGGAGGGRQTITAPLPGKVTHVAVAPGDVVAAGATIVVIEAMKMENEFKATAAGTVREVHVQPGQSVNPGDVLIVIG